jgi:hypothetical protein
MNMKRSRILTEVHETANAMFRSGTIDKQTLREFARLVYRTKNLPPKLATAIKNSRMDPAHDHLNALVETPPNRED